MRNVLDIMLTSRWLWRLARLLLVVVFVASGLAKLLAFETGLAEMRQAGLHPDWLFNIATAITLLGGSVLILLDRGLWLGSGALAVFLALTIVVVHRFWALPPERAQPALFWALEHLSLIGGLMTAAMASHLRKRLLAR